MHKRPHACAKIGHLLLLLTKSRPQISLLRSISLADLALLIGAALLFGVGAFLRTRRVASRLARLTESYWELRYDYTRLRSQVTRLDPDQAENQPAEPAPPASVSFVPLSSMRKKDQ